ncbi:MAG: hemolysin III family protein [Pseudomonadota bacterium]
MYPSPTLPERQVDGVVHAVGLAGVLAASVLLIQEVAPRGDPALLAAVWMYIFGAIFSLSVSSAYHLLPRHDWRAALRRWDHAAIYLAISGTISPLLIAADTYSATVILGIIWVFALAGVWFKLSGDNGDSRWSLISYIGLGALSMIALPDFWARLPLETCLAFASGAIFYTIGARFYVRRGMRFRYPIWHGFGTLGALSFFLAVWFAVSS